MNGAQINHRFSRLRILIASTIALLAAASAAVAPAADQGVQQNYIFTGHGWGHGVGMSQWGAKGLADQGKSAGEILAHYYRGIQIGNHQGTPNNQIRVRLFGSSSLSQVSVSGAKMWVVGANEVKLDETPGKWKVVANGLGRLDLYRPDGTSHTKGLTVVQFVDAGGGVTVLNSAGKRYHTYKGRIIVYPTGAKLYAVNLVDFEPVYLDGLAEMPSGWPQEALRAQAIAGRSYALATLHPQSTFDLYDSQMSQVYVGTDKVGGSLGSRWAAAVAATRGLVMRHNGSIVTAYYHSTSGGSTENNENVWAGAPLGYLRAADDPWAAKSPWTDWRVVLTRAQLEQKLKASKSTTFTGSLVSIEMTDVKGGRRISKVKITSTEKVTEVSGNNFRTALGLPSTWFGLLSLSDVWTTPNPFSPNFDGRSDSTSFGYTLTQESAVTVKIYNYKGAVKTLVADKIRSVGRHYEGWTGTADGGKVLPDGNYRYEIAAVKGASRVTANGVTALRGQVHVTDVWATPNPFTPNGDRQNDFTSIAYLIDQPAKVTVTILDAKGAVKVLTNAADRQPGRNFEGWTGTGSAGQVLPAGNYRVQVTATNRSSTSTAFGMVAIR